MTIYLFFVLIVCKYLGLNICYYFQLFGAYFRMIIVISEINCSNLLVIIYLNLLGLLELFGFFGFFEFFLDYWKYNQVFGVENQCG